ncbi:MAG: ATP synthase F0 subunit B [Chloroflexota bacterium]|nr:MAG: ATP synthase F0 subunit B [Chloroflexota bacterium]
MEALGINVPGLIAQIINFVILLALLRLVAYKPILSMLEKRSTKIRESMEAAERIKQEMTKSQQDFEVQLEAARKEGQAIIAQANQIGDRMKQEAREEAQKEATAIIAKARGEIELERDKAIGELRQQFADLTILAAGKVINRTLDPASHKKLIDEILVEAGDLAKN